MICVNHIQREMQISGSSLGSHAILFQKLHKPNVRCKLETSVNGMKIKQINTACMVYSTKEMNRAVESNIINSYPKNIHKGIFSLKSANKYEYSAWTGKVEIMNCIRLPERSRI